MKYLKLLFAILFITVLINSCGPNEPGDPPELIPISGYQYDIPWPSLADSPWPMHHGNPQSTGRSKYSGPKIGHVDLSIGDLNLDSGIILDSDSNVYVAGHYFFKIFNSQGNLLWQTPVEVENLTTPLLTSKGVLIMRDNRGLRAVSAEGDIDWIFTIRSKISSLNINIDLDGNVYVVDNSNTLYCINSNGELVWELNDDRIYPGAETSFSPDGKHLYLNGNNTPIICVNISTRQIVWEFGEFSSHGAPLVDSQGNVYVTGGYKDDITTIGLYSLNSSGVVRWFFSHRQWEFEWEFFLTHPEMTMDKFGNIFFGLDTLYSVSYAGKLNWKQYEGHTSSSLTCDNNGNVYYIEDRKGTAYALKAIDGKTGSHLWEIYFDEEYTWSTASSPALSDGIMYLPSQGKFIYKIK